MESTCQATVLSPFLEKYMQPLQWFQLKMLRCHETIYFPYLRIRGIAKVREEALNRLTLRFSCQLVYFVHEQTCAIKFIWKAAYTQCLIVGVGDDLIIG